MKPLLAIGLYLAFSLSSSQAESWQIDDFGKNVNTGKSVGRMLKLNSGNQIVYARREFDDPQLIPKDGVGIAENFYIQGKLILRLERFDHRTKSTFFPLEDYSIIVDDESETAEIRIRALSFQNKKEYTWTKDSKGFYTIFKAQDLKFTQKQLDAINKIKGN